MPRCMELTKTPSFSFNQSRTEGIIGSPAHKMCSRFHMPDLTQGQSGQQPESRHLDVLWIRKQWVSCFPSQGFMFSHLGFHVFPHGVSCFPLLRKFNVSMLTKRRHNRLRTCQATALCVGFNVTSHCGAQWFEPEACANVARNRPPFSR